MTSTPQLFKNVQGSRFSLFVAVEKPALRSLPSQPFEIASWHTATVGLDYHVVVFGHAYSVPHQHAKSRVDVRVTPHLLEIFRDHLRIATHHRVLDVSKTQRGHTTVKDHMPSHHRQWSDLTPTTLLTQAQQVGESTVALVQMLLNDERHPEQQLRAVQGVLRLGKAFGDQRLEAACRRAIFLQTSSVQSLESILKHRLDEARFPSSEAPPPVAVHANVRGPAYYGPPLVDDATPELDAALPEFDPTLN